MLEDKNEFWIAASYKMDNELLQPMRWIMNGYKLQKSNELLKVLKSYNINIELLQAKNE